MPNRPRVPAEIEREVLLESGHRCAICGTPFPIEQSHIVPWHKSKQHKAVDLICLCANCHEMADYGKLPQKTLREYKRRPWVLRQYKNPNNLAGHTSRIRLSIDVNLSDFDEKKQRLLQYALAAFLDIAPHDIVITSLYEVDSIRLTIQLPSRCAPRLSKAYKTDDPELAKFLAPFSLLNLHVEEKDRERKARNKIIIVDDKQPSRATFAHLISQTIEELTNGEYSAELMEGAIIADAFQDVKHLVQQMRNRGDAVKGILIDFVDETHKVLNAGAVLLRKVKADPVLRRIPVVMYTSRYVPEFSHAALVKSGAKAAFRRRRTGTQRGQMELGKQVLDAFGFRY